MRVGHHYHLWAAGEWREPVSEHLAALEDGGFDGPFYVGVVGPSADRAEALGVLGALRPPDGVVEAEEGWEQVSLSWLRERALREEGATLYAHTKGAAHPSGLARDWRRTMSLHVVRRWREALAPIERGEADAAGCHWLTPDLRPETDVVESPFFAGSYWLASNEYLRRLPPPAERHRYDAELWIGLASPRVVDLWPGWPGNAHLHDPYPIPYRAMPLGAG